MDGSCPRSCWAWPRGSFPTASPRCAAASTRSAPSSTSACVWRWAATAIPKTWWRCCPWPATSARWRASWSPRPAAAASPIAARTPVRKTPSPSWITARSSTGRSASSAAAAPRPAPIPPSSSRLAPASAPASPRPSPSIRTPARRASARRSASPAARASISAPSEPSRTSPTSPKRSGF